MMANTTNFQGDQNRGAQIGQNFGNVNYFGNYERKLSCCAKYRL